MNHNMLLEWLGLKVAAGESGDFCASPCCQVWWWISRWVVLKIKKNFIITVCGGFKDWASTSSPLLTVLRLTDLAQKGLHLYSMHNICSGNPPLLTQAAPALANTRIAPEWRQSDSYYFPLTIQCTSQWESAGHLSPIHLSLLLLGQKENRLEKYSGLILTDILFYYRKCSQISSGNVIAYVDAYSSNPA